MTPLKLRKWYLITAAIVSLEAAVGVLLQSVQGMIISTESFQLYNLIISVLFGAWLVTDPKFPADKRPSFDHGLLLWMTFPFFALYKLFTTRRWRGVLMLLGLMLLYGAPDLAFVILSFGT